MRRRMLGAMRTALPLLLTPALCIAVFAQTADRSASPPSAATSAPAAKPGAYTLQNGELLVAPGLKIPNGNVPWALDTVDSKQVLVPIHHTPLNAGASSAMLTDTASVSPLHSAMPVFFVHSSDRTENSGDSGRGTPTGWALLPVVEKNGVRTVQPPKFSEVNSATVCAAPVICTTAESLPDGWLRLALKEPLPQGEYALLPVQRAVPTTGNLLAYDFKVGGQQPA